jgi:hypothetical protein
LFVSADQVMEVKRVGTTPYRVKGLDLDTTAKNALSTR